MSKTIYRTVTPKRRTVRPKSARPKSGRPAVVAPYQGMLTRLQGASAVLRAARGR